MSTYGKRLAKAREIRGYSQRTLATAIGVSRGVIVNLESELTEPKEIITNAICNELNIRKEWLTENKKPMEANPADPSKSHVLGELTQAIQDMTEEEQEYLLVVARGMKKLLGAKQPKPNDAE